MKTVKAICAASVMALFLSLPAYADDPIPGDVHIPGKPCPITGCVVNPTTSPAGETTAVDGDISFSALADILWTLASIF